MDWPTVYALALPKCGLTVAEPRTCCRAVLCCVLVCPLGGLLRSALPAVSNVTARVNETITNMTSALDDMMSNATANGTTAALRAFGGLAQNPTSTVASGLGGLLQRLRTAVQQAAADRPAATAFQGITARSAMNAMNATLDSAMNATMNGTSAGNSTASQRGSMPKRHFMFL